MEEQDPYMPPKGSLRPLNNTYSKSFETLDKPTSMEAYNEYDKGFIPNSGMNQEHNRANNQSTLDLIGKGLKRFTVSAPLKFAEGLSDLGGLLKGTMPMDNPLSEGLREMEEHWKESNPIYRSQAYDEGTVWEKMTSGSFLANDLVDGAAFMVSAWGGTKLIGAGISKAITLGLPELELGAQALAQGTELSGGSRFVNTLLKYKLDANKLTRLTTTGLNTLSESMAEGIDSYKQVKEDLLRKKQLGLMGHSDYAKYAELGDDQIEAESRNAYQETFSGNLAILALPNWLESGWWLGKTGKAGFKEKFAKAFVAGKLEEEAEKVGLKHGVIAFAKGFASEGLWEENMQSALQAYEKSISDPTLTKNQRGMLPAMAGTFMNASTNLKGFGKSLLGGNTDANSEEGQGAISIWLGGALGSPMAVGGHYQELADNKKERTELQKSLDAANRDTKLFSHGHKKSESFAFDSFEKDDKGAIVRDEKGKPVMKFNTEKKVRDIQQQFFREMTAHHAVMADMTDNKIYGALNTMFSAFDLAMEIEQSRWDKDIKDEIVNKAIKNYEEMSKGSPAVPESVDEKGNVVPAKEAVEGTNIGNGLFTANLVNSYRTIYRNTYQEAYSKAFRSFDTNDINKKRFLLDMVHNQTIEKFRLSMLKTLLEGNGSLTEEGLSPSYLASESGQEQLRTLIKEKEASIEKYDMRKNKSGLDAMYQEYQAAQSIDKIQEEWGKAEQEVEELTKSLDATTEQEVEQITKDKDGKEIKTKVKQKIGISEDLRKEINEKIKAKQAEVFLKRQRYEEQAGVHGKTIADNFYYDEKLAEDALAGKDVMDTGRFQRKRIAGSRTRIGGRFSRYQNGHLATVQNKFLSSISANIIANRVKMVGDLTLIDQLQDLMKEYADSNFTVDQYGQVDEGKVIAVIEKMLRLITDNHAILYQASLFDDSVISQFLDLVEGIKNHGESLREEIISLGQEMEFLLAQIEPTSPLFTDNQQAFYEMDIIQKNANLDLNTFLSTNLEPEHEGGIAVIDMLAETVGIDIDRLIELQQELGAFLTQLEGIKNRIHEVEELIKDKQALVVEYTNLLKSIPASETTRPRIGLIKAVSIYEQTVKERNKNRYNIKNTKTKYYGNTKDYDRNAQLEIESEWNIVPSEAYFREHLIDAYTGDAFDAVKAILSEAHIYYDQFDLSAPDSWVLKPDVSFKLPLVEARALKADIEEVLAAASVEYKIEKDDDKVRTKEELEVKRKQDEISKALNAIAKSYRDTVKGMKLSMDGTVSDVELGLKQVLDVLNSVIQNEDNRQAINIQRMRDYETQQRASHETVLDVINDTVGTKLDDSYGLFRALQDIKENSGTTKQHVAEERLKAKRKAINEAMDTLLASMKLKSLPRELDEMQGATKMNALLFSDSMLMYLLGHTTPKPSQALIGEAFSAFSFIRTLQSTGDALQAIKDIEKDSRLEGKKEALIQLISNTLSLAPIELAEAYFYSTIGDKGKGDMKYEALKTIVTSIDSAPTTGLGFAPNYLQVNAFIESAINFDIGQKEEALFLSEAIGSDIENPMLVVIKDGVPIFKDRKSYDKTITEKPLRANLLLGVSGSGKTVGAQLLIKYYLASGGDASKVLLIGHTASSAQNLKNETANAATGTSKMTAVTNVEFYNMTPESRSKFDLIVADEQFTLSTNEMNLAMRPALVNAYAVGSDTFTEKLKTNTFGLNKAPVIFLLGDSSQPRGEILNYATQLEMAYNLNNTLNYSRIRRITPLSIGYRASVQAIESVAYQFKGNLNRVSLERTEANKSLDQYEKQDAQAIIEQNKTAERKESLDIIGLISEYDADAKTRQAKVLSVAAMLDKNMTGDKPKTVIIVANENKKAEYLEQLRISTAFREGYKQRIEVMTFSDVQGRTFENVLIDYVETDKMIQREIRFNTDTRKFEEQYVEIGLNDLGLSISSDYKKNANIYMGITRGKKFVYMNGIANAELKTDNKLQEHVFAATKEAEALRANYADIKKNWGVEAKLGASPAKPEDAPIPPPIDEATPPPPSAPLPEPPIAPIPPVSDIDEATEIVNQEEELNDEDEYQEDNTPRLDAEDLEEEDTLDFVIEEAQTIKTKDAIDTANLTETGTEKISIQHPQTIEGTEFRVDDNETIIVQQRYRMLEDKEQIENGKQIVYPAGPDSKKIKGQEDNPDYDIPNAICVPTFSRTEINGKQVDAVTTRIFIPLVKATPNGEMFTGLYINAGTLRHVSKGYESETERLGIGQELNKLLNNISPNEFESLANSTIGWHPMIINGSDINNQRNRLAELNVNTSSVMPEMIVHAQSDMRVRNFDPATATEPLLLASQTVIKALSDLAKKDNQNVNDDTLRNFIETIVDASGNLRLDTEFFLNGRARASQNLPAMLFEINTRAIVSEHSKRGVNVLSLASQSIKDALGEKGDHNGIFGMPMIILKNIPIGSRNGVPVLRDLFIPLRLPRLDEESETVKTFQSLIANLNAFKSKLSPVLASTSTTLEDILLMDTIRIQEELNLGLGTNETRTNLLNTPILSVLLYAGQSLFETAEGNFRRKQLTKNQFVQSLVDSFEEAKNKILKDNYDNATLVDKSKGLDKDEPLSPARKALKEKIEREQEGENSQTSILARQFVSLIQSIQNADDTMLEELMDSLGDMVHGTQGSFFGKSIKNKMFDLSSVREQVNEDNKRKGNPEQTQSELIDQLIRDLLLGKRVSKLAFEIGDTFSENGEKNNAVTFELASKMPRELYLLLEPMIKGVALKTNGMSESDKKAYVDTLEIEAFFNQANKLKLPSDTIGTYEDFQNALSNLQYKRISYRTDTKAPIIEKEPMFDIKASLLHYAHEQFVLSNAKFKDSNGNTKRLLMPKFDSYAGNKEKQEKTGRKSMFNVIARLMDTNFNFATKQRIIRKRLERKVENQDISQFADFPFLFEIKESEEKNRGRYQKRQIAGINQDAFEAWMERALEDRVEGEENPYWNAGTIAVENPITPTQARALNLAIWRHFEDNALGLLEFLQTMEKMGDASFKDELLGQNNLPLPLPLTESDIAHVTSNAKDYKQPVTYGHIGNQDKRVENEKKLGTDQPSDLNTESIHTALSMVDDINPKSKEAATEIAKNILGKLDKAFDAVPFSITPNKLEIQKARKEQAEEAPKQGESSQEQARNNDISNGPIQTPPVSDVQNIIQTIETDPNGTVIEKGDALESVEPIDNASQLKSVLASLNERIKKGNYDLKNKTQRKQVVRAILTTLNKELSSSNAAAYEGNNKNKLAEAIVSVIEGSPVQKSFDNAQFSDIDDVTLTPLQFETDLANILPKLNELTIISAPEISKRGKVKEGDEEVAFSRQAVNEGLKSIRKKLESDLLSYAQSVLSKFGLDEGAVKMVSRMQDDVMQTADAEETAKMSGKKVWGYVRKGAIVLEKSATRTDFNHEFFHYTFRYLMTEQERQLMLKNAISQYGEPFKSMQFLEQEEFLAVQFEKYMQFRKFAPEQEKPTTLRGKAKSFLEKQFDRLLQIFNWIIGRSAKSDFEAIRRGQYKIYNNTWGMLYSGEAYETAFSSGTQADAIENEFSVEGATIHGLIREIFSKLPEASQKDYLDYVSTVEYTIAELYMIGEKSTKTERKEVAGKNELGQSITTTLDVQGNYALTYHQAIGQAFSALMKREEEALNELPEVFKKLKDSYASKTPEEARKQKYQIFTEVVKAFIQDIDKYVDIDIDNTVDMGERIINQDNEKKKAEDNPTTHLRHVLKTFTRRGLRKTVFTITKEKILLDTVDKIRFSDLARLDTTIGSVKDKSGWMASDSIRNHVLDLDDTLARPAIPVEASNSNAIKRRIATMRIDARIENSALTDSPSTGERRIPLNAGDMKYRFDKYKNGYSLEYTNGNFKRVFYIDGRVAGHNHAYSAQQMHETLIDELEAYAMVAVLEDKMSQSEYDALMKTISSRNVFNLLVRRAEADQQLKSLSQTLGSLTKQDMVSDTEGYVRGKLELVRSKNSVSVSYEDIRSSLSDGIFAGVESFLRKEDYEEVDYKVDSEDVKQELKKELLRVKGFKEDEIRVEMEVAETKEKLKEIDNIFDDLYDYLIQNKAIRERFLNRNNPDVLVEEDDSVLDRIEEVVFLGNKGKAGRIVGIDFRQRIIESTKFINELDTETIKLTMKSANGDMLYTFQNATFMTELWREMKLYKGKLAQLQAAYPFLKSDNFKYNAFNIEALGKQQIFDFYAYDAYKQTYTESIKVHKAENEQEFLRRVVNYHFLHNMASADMTADGGVSALKYDQETFPLEGRSRLQMASISFLTSKELKGSVFLILSQLRNRKHDLIQSVLKSPAVKKGDVFTNHVLNYLGMSESMLLGEGVSRAHIDAFKAALNMNDIMNESLDLSLLSTKLNDALVPIMEQLGKSVWQNMVKYEKTIHPKLLLAARNMQRQGWLTKEELDTMVKILAPTASEGTYPNIAKNIKDETTGARTYFYNELSDTNKEILDGLMAKLMGAYQYNRYVNSYHLNQMIAGDLIMYKEDLDLIKRLLGTSTPGQNFQVDTATKLLEGEDYTSPSYRARTRGTTPYTNAIIIKDSVVENRMDWATDEAGNLVPDNTRSMEASLRRILKPLDSELETLLRTEKSKLITDDDVNAAIEMVLKAHGKPGFDVTDGYCIMRESGYENLKRGLSEAYDLGDAQKLIYFGIDEHLEQLRKEGISTPYYVKSSYLVLTKELIAQYPALKRLDEFLEAANVDEGHFASSVKVGATKDQYKYEEIMESSEQAKLKGAAGIENGRIVRMNNKYRKAVYNPISKLDSKISLFTQMFYMQMVNTPSGEKSSDITAALGFLFEKGIQREIASMENNFGKFIQSVIRNAPVLAAYDEYLTGTLDEDTIAQLMTDSTIRKAVMTGIISTITKKALDVKFKGAKLISAPSDILASTGDKPLTIRQEMITDSQGNKTIQYVSDCIVSEGMLSPEQKEWFDNQAQRKDANTGIDIDSQMPFFEKGDFLSMRLPTTGKHSGVVLRAVGYHKSPANIIFVAPEASKILGEDYDVDARFTVFRERWAGDDINIGYTINGVMNTLRVDKGQPVGYYQKRVQYQKQVMVDGNHNGYRLSQPTEHSVWSTSKDHMMSLTDKIDGLRTHITGLLAQQTDRQSVAYKQLQRELKALDKYEDVLLKNLIVETIMDNLSSPDHIIEMMLPITTEQFISLIDKLRDELGWFDEINEKYNPSIIRDILGLHSNIHGGDIITGAGANGFKELAYVFNTSLDDVAVKDMDELKKKITKRKVDRKKERGETDESKTAYSAKYTKTFLDEESKADKIAINAIYKAANERSLQHGNVASSKRRTGLAFMQMPIVIGNDNNTVSYGHITENGYWKENGVEKFGLSIWEQLDAIINLALDNLKENKLGKLSISNDTFQAILGGLALGMPFQQENNLIGNLIYQPAIKMLTHSQYVGISDIHKRIGLDLLKKDNKANPNAERVVAYVNGFKDGYNNNIGDTLVKILSFLDAELLSASKIEGKEEGASSSFYDLNVYLATTSANAQTWEHNAHKGYFKAMEAVLLDMSVRLSNDMPSQLGSEFTAGKLIEKVNAVLKSITKEDLTTRAFEDNQLFTKESFVIFLKQNLKALSVFKQLDILGADINLMNKPIAALRVNPTDQVEVQEVLSDKKIFGPTLTNMKSRYKKNMSFKGYKEAISTGDFRIRVKGLSINPENFINKQPHIYGAQLGIESAQRINEKFIPIESSVLKSFIDDTLQMLSEDKYPNILAVRANNHISEEAKIILIKEELSRYGMFLAYKDFMTEDGSLGADIDLGLLKEGVTAIIEAFKTRSVSGLASNKILSALRFDNRGTLRFRGTDMLDKKNHQAYIEAANTLSNFHFNTITSKIMTAKDLADFKKTPQYAKSASKIVQLDVYIGLFLKLNQQGYGTEHKAYTLLSSETKGLLSEISLAGLEQIKEMIEEGTETIIEKNAEGKDVSSKTFSPELTNMRQAFTEALLRRNQDKMPEIYASPSNGIRFVHKDEAFLRKGGEGKPLKDWSGVDSGAVKDGRGLFYDLKIVTDKNMPPYIRTQNSVYVRMYSTYDAEIEMAERRDIKGNVIKRESKAKTGGAQNNVHYFVKLPSSTAFTFGSYLKNRLDASYLTLLPNELSESNGTLYFTVREQLDKRLAESEKDTNNIAFIYNKNDVSLTNPQPVHITGKGIEIATNNGRGFIYYKYAYEKVNINIENYEGNDLHSPIKTNYDIFVAARALEEEDELTTSCDR